MRRKELEFRDLRNFLAVADALHFSRAALDLGIAQPVLSKQIKQLEDRLGGPLFKRTTRGVKLTQSGLFFRRRAEAIRASLRDSVRTTRRLGRGQEGTLSIGFCDSVIFTRFALIIEKFRNEYPKVDVVLREISRKRQIERLREGTLDLGFARFGTSVEGLVVERLFSEAYIVLLPELHPLAMHACIRPADLQSERLVLFASARQTFLRLLREGGCKQEVYQEASQWSTVLSLVSAGMGVSIAPESVASLQAQGTTHKSLDSPRRSSVDVMTCPEVLNPVARVFLAKAKSGLRQVAEI